MGRGGSTSLKKIKIKINGVYSILPEQAEHAASVLERCLL